MTDPLRAALDALPWLDVTLEDGESGGQMVSRNAVLDIIDAALTADPARPGLDEVLSVLSDVPHDDQHPCTACRRDGALAAARLMEGRP